MEPPRDKIILPASDEKLLELCDVDTFRSSGSGGQHVNKTDSAVRITYKPLNIVVTCQQERSQLLNKMICLKKLREKVDRLNYRAPKRIATKVPRRIKEEALQHKHERSEKKKMRGRIRFEKE